MTSEQLQENRSIERISPRQAELLRLLGQGLTLKEAARQMGVTRKTANDHKCRMMYQLNLQSRKDVMDYARKVFSELNPGT